MAMSLTDLFHQLSLLIGLPVVLLAGAGAAFIVIARDWRVAVLGYTVVSIGLALLFSQIIPTQWALLQIIVGGLIAVMLYLSASQLRPKPHELLHWEARWPRMASLTSFRALTVGLAAAIFFLVHESVQLPQLESLFRDALLWLVLMELLGLALHEEPLHAGLSLLTFLGGAELLLFTLTQRRMLVGMMFGGQLLLGLAVSYLVLAYGLGARMSDGEAT